MIDCQLSYSAVDVAIVGVGRKSVDLVTQLNTLPFGVIRKSADLTVLTAGCERSRSLAAHLLVAIDSPLHAHTSFDSTVLCSLVVLLPVILPLSFSARLSRWLPSVFLSPSAVSQWSSSALL